MPIRPLRQDVHAVVLVPFEDRWQSLRDAYEDLRPGIALGCEFLSRNFGRLRVVFVNTGGEAVEAAVSAQYAVDRWAPRVLAFDGTHEAFDHVAMRNGLALTPVEELWDTLEPAAHAGPQTEPSAQFSPPPEPATDVDAPAGQAAHESPPIEAAKEVDAPAEQTAHAGPQTEPTTDSQ